MPLGTFIVTRQNHLWFSVHTFWRLLSRIHEENMPYMLCHYSDVWIECHGQLVSCFVFWRSQVYVSAQKLGVLSDIVYCSPNSLQKTAGRVVQRR